MRLVFACVKRSARDATRATNLSRRSLAPGNYIGIHRVYRDGSGVFFHLPRRYRLAACAAQSCIFLHGKARRACRYVRDIKLPLRVRSFFIGIGNDKRKRKLSALTSSLSLPRDWKTRKFIILTFRARQKGIEFLRSFFTRFCSANLHVFKHDYDRHLFDEARQERLGTKE